MKKEAAPRRGRGTWRHYGGNWRESPLPFERKAEARSGIERSWCVGVYPEADGGQRPLGVHGAEDKIVPARAVEVVNAITETILSRFFRTGSDLGDPASKRLIFLALYNGTADDKG